MLTAGSGGSIGINADVVRLDLDFIVLGQLRHHLAGHKGSLPLPLCVEGTDPHQTMYAVLRTKEPVRVRPVDLKIHGLDARLVAVHQIHNIQGKALLISPPGIHAEEHGAPVAGLRAAGSRVQRDNGVILIVFTGQERGQPQLLQMRLEIIQFTPHILRRRGILILVGHLNQIENILILALESVCLLHGFLQILERLHLSVGLLRIAPEIRSLHLSGKLLDSLLLERNVQRIHTLPEGILQILQFNFHLVQFNHTLPVS